MHDFQRIRGLERQPPGEHLVQRHAEGVEIGPIVHVAVHPARLLGRHVRDRALQHIRMARRTVLEGQPRRDAEVDERRASHGPVDQDVVGIDVLVNDAAPVQGGDSVGELDAQPKRSAEVEPPRGKQGLEPLAADVLEDERGPIPSRHEAVRPRHTGYVEILDQVVLTAQACAGNGGGDAIGERLEDHRDAIPIASPAVDDARPAPIDLFRDGETVNQHRPPTARHAADPRREVSPGTG